LIWRNNVRATVSEVWPSVTALSRIRLPWPTISAKDKLLDTFLSYSIADNLLSDVWVDGFSECRIGGSSDSSVDAKRGMPGETFRLINRAWKPANITYAVFSRSYYSSSVKEVQNLLRITLPGDSASFPGDANRDWIFGVYDEFTHPGFQSLPTPSPSPAARTPNAGTVLTPFMSTVTVIVGTVAAMLCLLQ
jgi:hypothetical protein